MPNYADGYQRSPHLPLYASSQGLVDTIRTSREEVPDVFVVVYRGGMRKLTID